LTFELACFSTSNNRLVDQAAQAPPAALDLQKNGGFGFGSAHMSLQTLHLPLSLLASAHRTAD